MDFSDELQYSFSRSSGSGGQHVNKVSTQVELRFHVEQSIHLSEKEKLTIKQKLGNRISSDGFLILTESKSRSQFSNKKKVTIRFYSLIEESLKTVKPRIAVKVPRSVIAKRKLNKRLSSQKKQNRKKPNLGDLD
jgi:ribosome-associated protein